MQKQSSVDESGTKHKIQYTQSNPKHPTGSPFSMRLPRNENLPVGLSSHKSGDEFSGRLSHALAHSKKRKPVKPYLSLLPATTKLRFEVFKRDGFACKYCGAGAEDGMKLNIDHIIPVSRGGTNDMDNLITACHLCNAGKRDVLISENAMQFKKWNAGKKEVSA